jgi:serine/threonine-protein kinase
MQRLGAYTLVEQLGRGGMGEVWLARRGDAGGDVVVVKTMRNDHEHADGHRRFVDEARLALLLLHPCICRTIDAGVDEASGAHFIVLEAIEGADANEVRSFGALDETVALWIAGCTLDALAFAHEATHPLTGAPLGVVHRDVSLHNVMCTNTGDVKLIDFGVALSTVREAQTETGIVVGKLAYMPPEQASGARMTPKGDVFSAGVALYELIAPEPYWAGVDAGDIWRRVVAGGYRPQHFDALAADVRALLERMWSERIDERPSAVEARDAIGAMLRARGAANDDPRKTLAAIVTRSAATTIERIRTARTVREIEIAPAQTPTLPFASLASEHALAAAIEAASKRAPSSPTLTLLALDLGDPRTVDLHVVAPHRAATETLQPAAHVAAPHVAAPHVAAPHVAAPHVAAPHIAAPRVVASHPSAPPRWKSIVVAAGGAGLAVVVVALVGVAVLRDDRASASPVAAAIAPPAASAPPPTDATASSHAASAPAPPPSTTTTTAEAPPATTTTMTTASAPPTSTPATAPTSAAASQPGAPPSLRAMLAALSSCHEMCADSLREMFRKNDADKLAPPVAHNLRGMLRGCASTCTKAR